MITIQQDIGTDIWVNVFSLTRTHYLVTFTNFITDVTKTCICANLEELTLAFVEQSTDDALNGKLALRPSGRWLMTVYLQPIGDEATNLDTSLADEIQSVRVQVESYNDN